VPIPCYELKSIEQKLNGETFAVPAVMIQLEENFGKNNIEPKKLFVYNDATQQFYTLSYEKVGDDVEAKP
jgi:hypothetical protein